MGCLQLAVPKLANLADVAYCWKFLLVCERAAATDITAHDGTWHVTFWASKEVRHAP